MWNRLTLKIKITILTTLALAFVAIGITSISVYNAGRVMFEPSGWESLVDDGYIQALLIPAELLDDVHYFPSTEATMMEFQRMANESQRDFQNISIAVVTAFIFLGAIGAYVISGQTIKPLESLARKIEGIDANNLSAPIEHSTGNDEVARLTHSFNNMLGKLNRSFDAQKLFAQNAAHELKTPLAHIRGSIEVLNLEEKPSEDEYKETIGIIADSSERLIELVEGLLSMSSMADGQKWQSLSAMEVFEAAIDELGMDIAQRGIDISVTGDCTMIGDKALLARAFGNLVHNAIRYNNDNGVVRITLSNESITIEDNGVGVPEGHLPHLFEPFYRVDKSRSKKLGGHGLGLAIAKSIFDRHGMEISIASVYGKGTTISIRNT